MNFIKFSANLRAILLSLIVCFGPFKAWAADTYDSSTSILTISSVAVGDILYTNVKAIVKSVESVGTSSVTDSYDTYNNDFGSVGVFDSTADSNLTSYPLFAYFMFVKMKCSIDCIEDKLVPTGNESSL